MKYKFLPAAVLLSLILIISACRDKQDTEETVVPKAELSMSHLFTYDQNTKKTITHRPADIIAMASNSSTEFYFYSGVENLLNKDFTGNDHISFKIAPEKLKPNLVGNYTLESLPNTLPGDASVYYVHYASASGGTIFDSSWNTLGGYFEIKTYDAKNKLITGHYTLFINQVRDPYTTESGSANARNIDILVAGTFKNVQVQ